MIRADVVVVGSGIAGLFFALKASRYGSVAVVTKKSRPESSTNWAQASSIRFTRATLRPCTGTRRSG